MSAHSLVLIKLMVLTSLALLLPIIGAIFSCTFINKLILKIA